MGRTVVIVGGGYGGAALATALDAEADVILIDPRDAFVNSAGSLRGLTRPDWAHHLFFPYDGMLSRGTVVRDRVVAADPGGVTLASGRRIDADHLVLASGSRYPYPAKPRADSTDEAIEDLRRTHKELSEAGHVLVLGAGAVGLELAGEIAEVWPDKRVTVLDPATELLPGFLPQVRADLHHQLDERGIVLRLGAALLAPPPGEPGYARPFTVALSGGEEVTADIWFRAHGVQVDCDYLADGALVTRTARGEIPVTESLTVRGYDHVYAIGDVTDVAETKRAGHAMRHADVVARNIAARLRGEPPTATYRPSTEPMILLPLGPRGGVGQLPGPDGPSAVPAATVAEQKGADLFTERFARMFGRR